MYILYYKKIVFLARAIGRLKHNPNLNELARGLSNSNLELKWEYFPNILDYRYSWPTRHGLDTTVLAPNILGLTLSDYRDGSCCACLRAQLSIPGTTPIIAN